MYCENCRTSYSKDKKICPVCGKQLRSYSAGCARPIRICPEDFDKGTLNNRVSFKTSREKENQYFDEYEDTTEKSEQTHFNEYENVSFKYQETASDGHTRPSNKIMFPKNIKKIFSVALMLLLGCVSCFAFMKMNLTNSSISEGQAFDNSSPENNNLPSSSKKNPKTSLNSNKEENSDEENDSTSEPQVSEEIDSENSENSSENDETASENDNENTIEEKDSEGNIIKNPSNNSGNTNSNTNKPAYNKNDGLNNIPDGCYRFRNLQSGLNLDAAGSNAQQGSWADSNKWTLNYAGNGYYKLTNGSGVLNSNGSNAFISSDNGSDSQLFKITPGEYGTYKIVPKNNGGSCLEVEGSSHDSGANVRPASSNNGRNQYWYIDSCS